MIAFRNGSSGDGLPGNLALAAAIHEVMCAGAHRRCRDFVNSPLSGLCPGAGGRKMMAGPRVQEQATAHETSELPQISPEAAQAAAEQEKQNSAATAQDSGLIDLVGGVADVVDLGASAVSSIFDIFS
jgi:hypothetical protein